MNNPDKTKAAEVKQSPQQPTPAPKISSGNKELDAFVREALQTVFNSKK